MAQDVHHRPDVAHMWNQWIPWQKCNFRSVMVFSEINPICHLTSACDGMESLVWLKLPFLYLNSLGFPVICISYFESYGPSPPIRPCWWCGGAQCLRLPFRSELCPWYTVRPTSMWYELKLNFNICFVSDSERTYTLKWKSEHQTPVSPLPSCSVNIVSFEWVLPKPAVSIHWPLCDGHILSL